MSWSATSIEEFANITPVNPPVVNKKINPNVQSIGGWVEGFDP